MINKIISLSLISIFTLISCKKEEVKKEPIAEEDITKYVDPFIGTGGHGHTFPGATTPFGMIQLSPVNGISGWDWVSGYHYSDSLVVGFGHLSLSGTGIGDLNDVVLMPANQEYDLSTLTIGKKDQYFKDADKFRDLIPYKSKYSHEKETAKVGYYQVYLEDPKVNAEFTADTYVGMHKYTFEKGDMQSIILNLGFAINWDNPTQMSIRQNINDKDTTIQPNKIFGYRYSTGWAKNQKVYFAIEFSKDITNIKYNKDKENITSAQIFFDNTDEKLLARVALSSVSVENAYDNLKSNTDGFDFDKMYASTKDKWKKELSSIEIETDVDSLKTIFYTALYHTKVAPVTFSDKNGEFRQQNDEIYKENTFTTYSTLSLWDTFRAENPLITLLTPERSSDIINSILAYSDVYQKLPIWTLYGNETECMTGYHSIPVIVEAYKKGIRTFDVEKAYQMMKKTMLGTERGLEFYNKYGFIPCDKYDESVTVTLEYAYDDWCIAQMAKELGKEEDYETFMKRSKAYLHLFDKETKFMRGKFVDGTWRTPFDPKHSNHREATDYTEGNAWQHSWFVLHDVEGFMGQFKDKEDFNTHLEKLFTESSEITGDNVSADITGLIGQYAHGNEPSHHIAYLFNKSGQPHRTQYWVNEILQTQYNTTPNGVSGNEDCGQMSAWYIWSSLGFYPFNPVSTQYEIGRPIFDKAKINLPNGKKFTIIANNVSKNNMYIQSITLNGEKLNRTFITDEEIKAGGELIFEMGDKPLL
ncbi:MAG: GH92 family glycosyl hydrolase [Capnocytophaga sp.]|nr:GH92 family glycosyl hydrolase [Capnocytophaga sp.]